MKKIIGILVSLTVITVFIIGCNYFYKNYQTVAANAGLYESETKTLEQELALLQKQLDENGIYIAGQEEYISELTQQIADLQTLASEPEESGDLPSNSTHYSYIDNYPELYTGKGFEQPNSGEVKPVYLTFDDGPSSLTPKVLDLLDEYGAKATFFVVYKAEEEYTKHLSEIVNRGHTLALHSYSHDYKKIYASVDAFLSDFQKVFDWVYEETRQRPVLFRFPGGSANGRKSVTDEIVTEMERRGFIYYDWNVSSGDGSDLTETEHIVENICNNIRYFENPVVLMHDGAGKNATLRALPTVLQTLKDKGYSFRALDETSETVQYKR